MTINWTAPTACFSGNGILTVYAVGTNVTAYVTDLSVTCIANFGSSGSIPLAYGTHSIQVLTSCSTANTVININGTIYTVTSSPNVYTVSNTSANPNVSISVTCN